jgi:DnaJ-class molecular chaperone
MTQNLIHGPLADGSGGLPSLEHLCETCGGKGKIEPRKIGNSIELGGRCDQCRGAGSISTADGERLWAFLERRRIFPR